LIISPYAKKGLIDHTLADHTSILKFIEKLYGLPTLTTRDAQANDLLEAFDFSQSPRSPLVLPGEYIPDHYPLILLGDKQSSFVIWLLPVLIIVFALIGIKIGLNNRKKSRA
jgi:phospholipase C